MRVVLLTLALWLPWIAAAAQPVPAQTFLGRIVEARIVRVADGDTLELVPLGHRDRVRVRLEGVDAPELGEEFSRDAQIFLRQLLLDRQVRVNGRDVDRYGRLVARVDVGGRDASQALLAAGLACQRFATDAVLAAAESQARAAGRGFWAANARKPRCATRAPVNTPRSPQAPSARAAPRAGSADSTVVRGNVSSMLYHREGCPNFRCRNCTRLFASEAAARAAGFRPARDCAQ
jgi:endonuclease YncB( thermonuclease family)